MRLAEKTTKGGIKLLFVSFYLGARRETRVDTTLEASGRCSKKKKRFAVAVSGLEFERHCGRQPRGELGLYHLEARRGGFYTFLLQLRLTRPIHTTVDTRWSISIVSSAD